MGKAWAETSREGRRLVGVARKFRDIRLFDSPFLADSGREE